jgi:NTP-dependent ternary system trypsin peptidase co-occuring protein
VSGLSKLVQVSSEHGPVFFDVDEVPTGPERVSRRGENVVVELDERLETVLSSVHPAAEAVVGAFKALAPGEVAVEFGLRLDAQAGAVIAKTGVSGHFKVSLKWPAPPSSSR